MKHALKLLLIYLCSVSITHAQSWTEVGTANSSFTTDSVITSIVTDKEGNLYAGGYFINNSDHGYVAKWNGTIWSEVGAGRTNIHSSVVGVDSAGNVYTLAKDVNSPVYMVKWNGTEWKTIGAPNSNGIFSPIVVDKDQNVYLQATDNDQSVSYCYVAKGNEASGFERLGSGLNALLLNPGIIAMVMDSQNNIYIAGSFTRNYNMTEGAVKNCRVLKWDGINWSILGTEEEQLGIINALAVDGKGNIYASSHTLEGVLPDQIHRNYVSKWNGTAWTELGAGDHALQANDLITSMAVDTHGNLYVAGGFTNTDSKKYVAKWDGTSWSELGAGTGALNANGYIIVTTDISDNVYASGTFTNASGKRYVAKWTSSELVTGIRDPTDVATIALFPNPGGGIVKIQAPEEGILTIYGISGTLISEHKVEAGVSVLHLNDISAGMYTLFFKSNKDVMYAPVKFVKE